MGIFLEFERTVTTDKLNIDKFWKEGEEKGRPKAIPLHSGLQ